MYLPPSEGELFSLNCFVTKYPDVISLEFCNFLLINCHIILFGLEALAICDCIFFLASEITHL
jgi:hypothetical protein